MSLRVALAQINPTVGDMEGNRDRIAAMIDSARKDGADLVVFPEQAICGYPAEDLLLKPQFLQAVSRSLDEVAAAAKDLCVVVGFPEVAEDVYNSAAICYQGEIKKIYRKIHLPNYSVFDENRYFQSGTEPMVLDFDGLRVGITICEDIWLPGAPITSEVLAGDALCILNLSASPFFSGKAKERERMLSTRAADNGVYVCFVNMVGGQDELVFDGNSAVFDSLGHVIAQAAAFEEELLLCDIDLDSIIRDRLHDPRFRSEKRKARLQMDRISVVQVPRGKTAGEKPAIRPRTAEPLTGDGEVYKALVIGTRDYVGKNGFSKVVLGLSGGVDSALVATVAADALGPENVAGVFMPSRFTSQESYQDAKAMAENLGIEYMEIPIDETLSAYRMMLRQQFSGTEEGIAEENIQARIRGNILMALSNKFGYLVLTTGNKSEGSVGYSTLYGDMAGGFSVIKDVPKILVFDLCRHRNEKAKKDLILARILEKEPTAELREGQKDTDSLPPYPVLDPILKMYVEQDKSFDQIVAAGYDPGTVTRVIRMVDQNEYKRRQAPPGIKITPRALGKDRRLPITNHYHDVK